MENKVFICSAVPLLHFQLMPLDGDKVNLPLLAGGKGWRARYYVLIEWGSEMKMKVEF